MLQISLNHLYRPGGLQSNKSPASVLHGPTSSSGTGLGRSTSAGACTFVCSIKLWVRLSLSFRLGSVFLIKADSPIALFGTGSIGSMFSAPGTVISVSALDNFSSGKFLFSQSSAALGIGASFSLLTRRKLRFGDLPDVLGEIPTSSMASLVGFLPFVDVCRSAASSVVLISGPFEPARRGWGGRATVSLRWAGEGAGDIVVICFGARLGRLLNPPVDSACFLGEMEEVREQVGEISVWAGETARVMMSGASSTGGGAVAFGIAFDLIISFFCGGIFRCSSSVGGDPASLPLAGASSTITCFRAACFLPTSFLTAVHFILEGSGAVLLLSLCGDVG